MEKNKLLISMGITAVFSGVIIASTEIVRADDTTGVLMYRLYNHNSGEHFYTKDGTEKQNLVNVGWKYEGIGWYAPTEGSPVYRLYNSNAGDHHYTLSKKEKDNLVKVGWKYEGIGWYSADTTTGEKLYRAYNPNARAGSHNYTRSWEEQSSLIKVGWKDEGIAWYGIKQANPTITGVSDTVLNQTTESIDSLKGVKATDFLGTTLKVTVSGEINYKVAGTYTLTYTAVDSYGNKATKTRKVTVNAVANPTITGIKNLEFKKSSNNFNYDSGVKATDYSGQEINYKIETDLPKTNPKSGEYTVTYTAEDVFGNQATKVQKVTIINDLKPTFSGVEDSKVNIIIGSFDVNSGVQAIDGDGNQLNYTVDGKIDFTKVGENSLTYRAVDKVGNETVITRK
ncbi:immunoglobulin-like domain-containing protein, partial [Streptococcus infantarius]|uniref:immunoglobulin-like domain-containing protein n=2 Tax=Streptococcus infantarius TaxID=102684 RepID=UPI0022E42BBF